MREITSIDWNGHTIEFIPILSHKTLWVATLDEVRFDGELVATSGGFKFSDRAEANVQHEGKSVSLIIKSSICWRTFIDLNYELIIDGETISQGTAKTQIRW